MRRLKRPMLTSASESQERLTVLMTFPKWAVVLALLIQDLCYIPDFPYRLIHDSFILTMEALVMAHFWASRQKAKF